MRHLMNYCQSGGGQGWHHRGAFPYAPAERALSSSDGHGVQDSYIIVLSANRPLDRTDNFVSVKIMMDMTKERHYLAVDLGATSGRTILATFDGKKIRMKEVDTKC